MRKRRGKSVSAIAAASNLAAEDVAALGDTYASPDFRRHLARVFTRRALEAAVARAAAR